MWNNTCVGCDMHMCRAAPSPVRPSRHEPCESTSSAVQSADLQSPVAYDAVTGVVERSPAVPVASPSVAWAVASGSAIPRARDAGFDTGYS